MEDVKCKQALRVPCFDSPKPETHPVLSPNASQRPKKDTASDFSQKVKKYCFKACFFSKAKNISKLKKY